MANRYYWAGLPALFGLALFSGVPIFWIAFWFFLLWTACSLAWLLHITGKMDFILNIKPGYAVRGSYVDLELRVLNDSILPLPYSEFFIDGLDEKIFDSKTVSYQPAAGQPERERAEKLEFDDNYPLGSWKIIYRLKCLRRGYHAVGPFRVRLHTLFGALAVEKTFPGSREFPVYPRLIPFSGRYHVENIEAHGARRNIFYNPFNQLDHTESYDLRPFIPGDPFKLINWKVSARQGVIHVRRPDVTSQTRVVIGLEFSSDYYPSPSDQDLALEKVLSLAAHLLLNNFQVGVLSYDGSPLYLPPGRGERQFFLIRELFTNLKSSCRDTLLQHTYYNRRASNDRFIWVVHHLDYRYLMGLSYLRKPGEMISLMVTDEKLEVKSSKILGQFYLWQLVYRNKQVSAKRVETAWL